MAANEAKSQLVRSEEGDPKGLELGRQQGQAMARTIRHMVEEVAQGGEEVPCGEYLVAYAVEEAEGMYMPHGDGLRWVEPEEENAHIEVAVRDAADGRFIPGLTVRVTVIGDDRQEIGTHEHPLLWHPYLYHYGRNWTLPASGRYRLRVRFAAPEFPRHDRKNGHRFTTGGDVTFENVEIETGRD